MVACIGKIWAKIDLKRNKISQINLLTFQFKLSGYSTVLFKNNVETTRAKSFQSCQIAGFKNVDSRNSNISRSRKDKWVCGTTAVLQIEP